MERAKANSIRNIDTNLFLSLYAYVHQRRLERINKFIYSGTRTRLYIILNLMNETVQN